MVCIFEFILSRLVFVLQLVSTATIPIHLCPPPMPAESNTHTEHNANDNNGDEDESGRIGPRATSLIARIFVAAKLQKRTAKVSLVCNICLASFSFFQCLLFKPEYCVFYFLVSLNVNSETDLNLFFKTMCLVSRIFYQTDCAPINRVCRFRVAPRQLPLCPPRHWHS